MFCLYRFKADAADVEFVEKVCRWLTNAQVQIKSEVQLSNTQSRTIDASMDQLECLVKACEDHHANSTEVSALVLVGRLAGVFLGRFLAYFGFECSACWYMFSFYSSVQSLRCNL